MINTFTDRLMQIRGMHTLIRDSLTTKHDFVFYSDRLIRLVRISSTCFIYDTTASIFGLFTLSTLLHFFQVVEHGLGHLPFTEKQVITPTGKLIYTLSYLVVFDCSLPTLLWMKFFICLLLNVLFCFKYRICIFWCRFL